MKDSNFSGMTGGHESAVFLHMGNLALVERTVVFLRKLMLIIDQPSKARAQAILFSVDASQDKERGAR